MRACQLGKLPEVAADLSRFGAGDRICEQDDDGLVCEVVEGMARTSWITGEGRRVVDGFFGPGEIFGVAPWGHRACEAEAVCDSSIAWCKRRALEARALVDASVASRVWAWLGEEQAHTAARLSLLAHGTALEKLAHFLLEMADRLGGRSRFVLPMSRYDIGDYLGLSSETVSRTFSTLRDRGLVATDGRGVILLRLDALRRHAGAPN